MNENMKEAIDKLRKSGNSPDDVRRPDANMVDRVEMRLGVTLPPSYRDFLLSVGVLASGPVEISGIGNTGLNGENSSHVIFATEDARRKNVITHTMIEIGTVGDGSFYVIDCAERDRSGESPVYEVSVGGVNEGKERIADSFGSFLLKKVRDAIDDKGRAPKRDPSMSKEERRRQIEAYWKERANDFS